jgi:DNA-binding GntR family transcriptional regulator
MKHKNSFEEAYSLILEEIINGSLKPGEVVTEVYLAEKYGISRTPVREALSRFQCEGLINTSNRTKRIYTLSQHDIEEIFEMKELIEGNVAKEAALKLTEMQAEELRQIIEKMNRLSQTNPENESEEEALLNNWLILDGQFHELIFASAGNRRAQQYILKLNLQWHRLKVGLIAIEGRIGKAILEHEAIATAILARDPERARSAMVEHLDDLKKVIVKLMKAFNYIN